MPNAQRPEAAAGSIDSAESRAALRRIGQRFRRVGIQYRIMFYVVIGLMLMFGLLIFIGLRSANEAKRVNFEERLGTARTFSIILERDLLHVSADVSGATATLFRAAGESALQTEAEELLRHIAGTDSFGFFHAARVCIVGSDGQVLAEASDFPPGIRADGCIATVRDQQLPDEYNSLVPTAVPAAVGGFGAVVTRVGSGSNEVNWVIVDLLAYNSSETLGSALYGETAQALGSVDRTDFSHLEVFRPDGTVVLGIGSDEIPGALSTHFAAIQRLEGFDTPIVMRHLMPKGEEDHVTAVVPMRDSGFVMVLEQPIDVALALPIRLQRELFLWSGIGFFAALLVAWVTTRSIVKPTEELTAAAHRMAGGNLDSPIHVDAHAEVGILAASLESMRLQTRGAHSALAEAKADLELRVEERTARLGVLLDKIITAQEDERHRIARELHDETAQSIGALAIALDRARDNLNGGPSEAQRHLAQAKDIANQLLTETRRLILDLRPMVLDDLGLTPAIRWYAETRLGDAGIKTTLRVDRPGTRLPPHIETALFRIVQEAVNNIAKHSQASRADIELTFLENSARIVVADDGHGFDVADQIRRPATDGGFGLAGMRERVSLLSGRVDVRSDAASGTVIDVEVPIIVGTR